MHDIRHEAEREQAVEHGAREQRVAPPVVEVRAPLVTVRVALAEERVIDQHHGQVAHVPAVQLDDGEALAVLHAQRGDLAQAEDAHVLDVDGPRDEHQHLVPLLHQGARQVLGELGEAGAADERVELGGGERDLQGR